MIVGIFDVEAGLDKDEVSALQRSLGAGTVFQFPLGAMFGRLYWSNAGTQDEPHVIANSSNTKGCIIDRLALQPTIRAIENTVASNHTRANYRLSFVSGERILGTRLPECTSN